MLGFLIAFKCTNGKEKKYVYPCPNLYDHSPFKCNIPRVLGIDFFRNIPNFFSDLLIGKLVKLVQLKNIILCLGDRER